MEIFYKVDELEGKIIWAASEYFGELMGREYHLGMLEATQIASLQDNLTETARILLSAVAGAVIQHLLDQGVDVKMIFEQGKLQVGKQL